MGKWIRENLVLVSGIVLPLLLVGGFLVLNSMPRMLADPPEYDFLLVGYRYDYQNPGNYYLAFEVRDGQLTGRAIPKGENQQHLNRQYAGIFLYRAQDQAFEEIVFDLPAGIEDLEESLELDLGDANKLKLDKRKTSPDGYQFEYLGYRGRGGLLGEIFGMSRRYESNYVLKKGSAYIDLPAPTPDPYYYQNELHFMGWVVNEDTRP
jgi:hypothetical protein